MARIKALLVLAFIVGLAYVAYIMGPAYMNNFQFQDDLKTELRFMQNGGKSDDEIRAEVVKKALDNGVSVTPQQVRITRLNKTITVDVNYSVHVDLPGYSTDLNFHPTASNTLAL